MTNTMNIDIHHVTRVEGHGDIVVNVKNGTLEDCRFDISETPRFFEAMLRGRPYTEASHIASRICGICAVGHATASLRATENALNIVPSEQTQLLRKLMFDGEMLDSHILHTYMLVAPDFFNVSGVVSLASLKPDAVTRALRIKKLAGDLCATIGGRHTHPIAMTVGGFTHLPTVAEIKSIRTRLEDIRPDIDETVAFFKNLAWPQFERKTDYVALTKQNDYGFIDGTIHSTNGASFSTAEYLRVTNEYLLPFSPTKRTRLEGESYMVGALARFNNNYTQLHPRAKAAAAEFGIKPIVTNPYLNTVAQVIEMVHCVEDAINVCNDLIARGIQTEPLPGFKGKRGEGVGACEVPRGTLYHEYEIDAHGKIVSANCIIPTGQNLANLEADMHKLVPEIIDQGEDQVRSALEMLVRAYDPCISCSVHFLNIKFV
jgi:sulfhydrogenase subunit alpha